jgi:hypothetical protein
MVVQRPSMRDDIQGPTCSKHRASTLADVLYRCSLARDGARRSVVLPPIRHGATLIAMGNLIWGKLQCREGCMPPRTRSVDRSLKIASTH